MVEMFKLSTDSVHCLYAFYSSSFSYKFYTRVVVGTSSVNGIRIYPRGEKDRKDSACSEQWAAER